MPIVSASMHFANVFRCMGKGIDFLYRQGVHIGTQSDGTSGVSLLDYAYHSGDAKAAYYGDAPFGEFARYNVGRSVFFKT
jgi:hypothetical protein